MADNRYTSRVVGSTAVYRRWNTAISGYIDTKGNAIPVSPPRSPPEPLLWPTISPSQPPRDGSSLFLSLPTELRLMIYSYLTPDEKKINEAVDAQFGTTISTPKREVSTIYSYLYRSPGRVTKPNAIDSQVIWLFQINRQIREELLDTCFGDRTFVLEASLYSRSVGGLDVLPPRLGMTAWVKKLLFITVIDDEKYQAKGLADLRPLQEMVNLKELHLVFRALASFDPSRATNSPIHAIFHCVPAGTKLSIGFDDAVRERMSKELGSGVEYLFTNHAHALLAYDRINSRLHFQRLAADQGTLSGSRVNHGRCRFPICHEAHLGLHCVNSQTPGALPLPSRAVSCEGLKYRCGCLITVGDGGFNNHACQVERPQACLTREIPIVTVEEVPLTPPRRKRKSWRSFMGC